MLVYVDVTNVNGAIHNRSEDSLSQSRTSNSYLSVHMSSYEESGFFFVFNLFDA
jgi:hypothetical protein